MNKIALCIIATFTAVACSKMNDLSDRFLDEGEIIYAAMADSVAPHAGDGRIELEILVKTQRIDSIRIYWDNFGQQEDIFIGNKPGVYRKVINDLDEAAYLFQLVSIDMFGFKSLPFEVTGNVYGDDFRSMLQDREILSAVYTPATMTLTIRWAGEVSYGVGSELMYVNNNGREIIVSASATDNTTVINGWSLSYTLKYRTLFKPEAEALDIFRSEWKTKDVIN
jgi:hypothetical protein